MPLRVLEADQIMMLEGARRPSRFSRLEATPRLRGARFGPPPVSMVRGKNRYGMRAARSTAATFRVDNDVLGSLGDIAQTGNQMRATDILRMALHQIQRDERLKKAGSAIGYGGLGIPPFDQIVDVGESIVNGVKKAGNALKDAYNWTEDKLLAFGEDVLDAIEKYGCNFADKGLTEAIARAAAAGGACLSSGCSGAPAADQGAKKAIDYAKKLCGDAEKLNNMIKARRNEPGPKQNTPTYVPPTSGIPGMQVVSLARHTLAQATVDYPGWKCQGASLSPQCIVVRASGPRAEQRIGQVLPMGRCANQKKPFCTTPIAIGGGAAALLLLLL